ncbi:hypothetical protein ACEN85_16565, partial [Curtobacterium sp. CT11-45]|uniref:hypothetical protein n=1 Tax=Curtobacterium sp. CT11-45 TaxID=3243037 RepID=UPI0039AEEFE5
MFTEPSPFGVQASAVACGTVRASNEVDVTVVRDHGPATASAGRRNPAPPAQLFWASQVKPRAAVPPCTVVGAVLET